MKYALSHITDTQEHEAQFPLDTDGNRIIPYNLVALRAYVMDEGDTITDPDVGDYNPRTRSTTDRQSVALIATPDDYEPVIGQTLYDITDLDVCQSEHPDIYYPMLGQAWVSGELILDKSLIT